MISILEHIDQKKIDNLCKRHWENIDRPRAINAVRIEDKLNSLLPQLTESKEIAIVHNIIYLLEDLIISKPSYLETIIYNFDVSGYNTYISLNKPFREKINKAFGYQDRFRKSKSAVLLAQGLDLKSCPYCNAQYTLVTKDRSKNKLAFQLDHFYPKSLFPYLSMSFYNLIPTCGPCNNTKGNTRSYISDSYHPYVNESIGDDFTFKTDNFDIANAYLAGEKDYKVIIDDSKSSQKTKDHLEAYSITKLFARHNDIIEELVWKKYIYTKKYKDNLIDMFFTPSRLSKAELERLIVSNYTKKQDTHKRPLSKFTTDIARDLGLIK